MLNVSSTSGYKLSGSIQFSGLRLKVNITTPQHENFSSMSRKTLGTSLFMMQFIPENPVLLYKY